MKPMNVSAGNVFPLMLGSSTEITGRQGENAHDSGGGIQSIVQSFIGYLVVGLE